MTKLSTNKAFLKAVRSFRTSAKKFANKKTSEVSSEVLETRDELAMVAEIVSMVASNKLSSAKDDLTQKAYNAVAQAMVTAPVLKAQAEVAVARTTATVKTTANTLLKKIKR